MPATIALDVAPGDRARRQLADARQHMPAQQRVGLPPAPIVLAGVFREIALDILAERTGGALRAPLGRWIATACDREHVLGRELARFRKMDAARPGVAEPEPARPPLAAIDVIPALGAGRCDARRQATCERVPQCGGDRAGLALANGKVGQPHLARCLLGRSCRRDLR
jgi:hypothetical protein